MAATTWAARWARCVCRCGGALTDAGEEQWSHPTTDLGRRSAGGWGVGRSRRVSFSACAPCSALPLLISLLLCGADCLSGKLCKGQVWAARRDRRARRRQGERCRGAEACTVKAAAATPAHASPCCRPRERNSIHRTPNTAKCRAAPPHGAPAAPAA